jgi:Glu-tRNA(Gln) amidotransferase subunit E-like FAD-binding protein
MYKWLLIPPQCDQIQDVHYQNEKLEEIMSKYRENQAQAAVMFEKRKRDMNAKPMAGEFPYIDPSDENSKFYTKPDVPPIPHPAEVLEDLKKEFPDKPIEELVTMADAKVNEVIEQRRIEADAECKKMLETLKEEEEPEVKEARTE